MYTDGIKVELTEEDIKEAIEAGKKNKESFKQFIKPYSFGSPERCKEKGMMHTKLCKLAISAFYSAKGHKPLDKKEINDAINSPSLGISVRTYGNSEGFSRDYYVLLKQGEKVIGPTFIGPQEVELDAPPESEYPKMESTLIVEFPYSVLDLKTKTTIIVGKGKETESRYEVDFSRLK